ncbi:MAG TPA: V-type ATP synthase subunit E [Clostridia bacterium]|nr:V-type ATP synthase subunit E [Clostridia bacterium]HOS18258.1 V-type ATP synthase subunit E [Clostridia bacterium]HPK14859.1 V-type ATP synthase subunit E [Clostridia bacterium]
MTGLEKIVAAIRQEAQAEANAIVEQAKAEAARIRAGEQARSDALCAEIEASAAQRSADIERASVSAAGLARRRRLLEAKQEILAQTMEHALDRLHALPEQEYFSLLVKMAAGCAEPAEGELILCDRDLRRCPEEFTRRLDQALPEGAKLLLSRETRPIDGGFILRYGDIEHNCSFRAIFDARREELTDRVRGILFS